MGGDAGGDLPDRGLERGSRWAEVERIFRDMAIGWGHFGTIVRDWTAREWAREHFGLVGRSCGPTACTRPTGDERVAAVQHDPGGVLRLPDGNQESDLLAVEDPSRSGSGVGRWP